MLIISPFFSERVIDVCNNLYPDSVDFHLKLSLSVL